MKTLFRLIIISIFIFSSSIVQASFADRGFEIELDMNQNVEKIELSFATIQPVYFSSTALKNKQTKLIKLNRELTQQIISLHSNGHFDSIQVYNLIQRHEHFISYLNDYLYYQGVLERHPNYRDAKIGLEKSARNMRIYFRKMQEILKEA